MEIGARDVIEIVRDTPGQRANAFHALDAEKLHFQFLLLGDVGIDDEH